MKTIIALIMAVMMLFGVGVQADPADDIPAVVTECTSLSEISDAAGSNLCHPAVMGVSDEFYRLFDCQDYILAEYGFSVAGYDYCFRSAKTEKDISGVWINGEQAFEDGANEDITYAVGTAVKLGRWFIGDQQYVLIVEDQGEMDDETFRSITEEMAFLTDMNN